MSGKHDCIDGQEWRPRAKLGAAGTVKMGITESKTCASDLETLKPVTQGVRRAGKDAALTLLLFCFCVSFFAYMSDCLRRQEKTAGKEFVKAVWILCMYVCMYVWETM